jgi:hypothetical protein
VLDAVQDTATVEPLATPLTPVGALSELTAATPVPEPVEVKYAHAATASPIPPRTAMSTVTRERPLMACALRRLVVWSSRVME